MPRQHPVTIKQNPRGWAEDNNISLKCPILMCSFENQGSQYHSLLFTSCVHQPSPSLSTSLLPSSPSLFLSLSFFPYFLCSFLSVFFSVFLCLSSCLSFFSFLIIPLHLPDFFLKYRLLPKFSWITSGTQIDSWILYRFASLNSLPLPASKGDLRLPRWLSSKVLACNERDSGDEGSIPR